jgi:VIT1/CCC1 family predicted Fe2+/Mn2+ transporter
LDPVDRVSEVLFGLIMVMTFTGSLSVATAGHAEVRDMLVGALGCNVAWGLIDALFYLMGSVAERGRGLATLRAVRGAANPQQGQRLIAHALPPVVASILEAPQLEAMRQRLNELPEPPGRADLEKNDWLGALAVFLLVFVSTIPVVVPFVVLHDPMRAMRVSNGIAVVMLFLCGQKVGRMTGYHPWRTGLAMVLLGGILVAITMALGG